MAIKIAAFSCISDVSESGLFTSKPGSLMKLAVTMKKISMMKTTSSIGVKLISLSSSRAAALIAFLLIILLLVCLIQLRNQPSSIHLIQLGFLPKS